MTKTATMILLALATLTGCAYQTPAPGETVYLRVGDKLTVAALTKDANTINVGNALAQGVSEDDIRHGRLALAGCAQRTDTGWAERHWFVRLPQGETFVIGTQTSEFAEIEPATPKDQRGPLSRFVRKTGAPQPDEWGTLPYKSKAVACEASTTPGAVRVELSSTSNGWWLTSYKAVQAWIAALPPQALAAGDLYMASCAVGTDAWLEWFVQAAPGQQLQAGQLIAARAGNPVSAGAGPLSQVTAPALRDYRTEKLFGRPVVRCAP